MGDSLSVRSVQYLSMRAQRVTEFRELLDVCMRGAMRHRWYYLAEIASADPQIPTGLLIYDKQYSDALVEVFISTHDHKVLFGTSCFTGPGVPRQGRTLTATAGSITGLNEFIEAMKIALKAREP